MIYPCFIFQVFHVAEGNGGHFLQPFSPASTFVFVLVFGLIFVEGGVDFNKMTRVTRDSELFLKGI